MIRCSSLGFHRLRILEAAQYLAVLYCLGLVPAGWPIAAKGVPLLQTDIHIAAIPAELGDNGVTEPGRLSSVVLSTRQSAAGGTS